MSTSVTIYDYFIGILHVNGYILVKYTEYACVYILFVKSGSKCVSYASLRMVYRQLHIDAFIGLTLKVVSWSVFSMQYVCQLYLFHLHRQKVWVLPTPRNYIVIIDISRLHASFIIGNFSTFSCSPLPYGSTHATWHSSFI